MARCETGASAGRRVGGEGGIGLELKSADGGVEIMKGCGCAVHGVTACDIDLGSWSG